MSLSPCCFSYPIDFACGICGGKAMHPSPTGSVHRSIRKSGTRGSEKKSKQMTDLA